jgi:hypothetical protein
MMAGACVKAGRVAEPVDSLQFVRVLSEIMQIPKHH